MTAAGRVEPSRVIVVGAGVAGLAAVQAANNLDAIVFAFDVRSAAKEQVESMSIMFLEIDLKEDGKVKEDMQKICHQNGLKPQERCF